MGKQGGGGGAGERIATAARPWRLSGLSGLEAPAKAWPEPWKHAVTCYDEISLNVSLTRTSVSQEYHLTKHH